MPLVHDIPESVVRSLLCSGLDKGIGVIAADLGTGLEAGAGPGHAVGVGLCGHHLGELALALSDDLVCKFTVLGLRVKSESVGGLA